MTCCMRPMRASDDSNGSVLCVWLELSEGAVEGAGDSVAALAVRPRTKDPIFPNMGLLGGVRVVKAKVDVEVREVTDAPANSRDMSCWCRSLSASASNRSVSTAV